MTGKKPTEEEQSAHRRFLSESRDILLAAGPTFDENNSFPEGSIFLIEAHDFTEAHAFAESDPYYGAGIRAKIDVSRWAPVGYGRSYPVNPTDL